MKFSCLELPMIIVLVYNAENFQLSRLSDDYDRTPGNKKGKSFFEMKGAQKAASFMVR